MKNPPNKEELRIILITALLCLTSFLIGQITMQITYLNQPQGIRTSLDFIEPESWKELVEGYKQNSSQKY